jgi:hypothetical protein
MAGDPNARRDKMLADILKELRLATDLLKKIEKNTRKSTVTVSHHPYLEESSGTDSSAGGEVPTPPYGGYQQHEGPYGSGSQPYT